MACTSTTEPTDIVISTTAGTFTGTDAAPCVTREQLNSDYGGDLGLAINDVVKQLAPQGGGTVFVHSGGRMMTPISVLYTPTENVFRVVVDFLGNVVDLASPTSSPEDSPSFVRVSGGGQCSVQNAIVRAPEGQTKPIVHFDATFNFQPGDLNGYCTSHHNRFEGLDILGSGNSFDGVLIEMDHCGRVLNNVFKRVMVEGCRAVLKFKQHEPRINAQEKVKETWANYNNFLGIYGRDFVRLVEFEVDEEVEKPQIVGNFFSGIFGEVGAHTEGGLDGLAGTGNMYHHVWLRPPRSPDVADLQIPDIVVEPRGIDTYITAHDTRGLEDGGQGTTMLAPVVWRGTDLRRVHRGDRLP